MSPHSILQLQTLLSPPCVRHCRSSTKHIGRFKPHLRTSSLTITHCPQSLSPTLQEGQAIAVTVQLSGLEACLLHPPGDSESPSSVCHTHCPLLMQARVLRHPEGTPDPAPPLQAAWAQGKDNQSLPNPVLSRQGTLNCRAQLDSQTIFQLRYHEYNLY